MKLLVLKNHKKIKPDVIIGKTGVIRFNKNYSSEMGIVKGSLCSISIDE